MTKTVDLRDAATFTHPHDLEQIVLTDRRVIVCRDDGTWQAPKGHHLALQGVAAYDSFEKETDAQCQLRVVSLVDFDKVADWADYSVMNAEDFDSLKEFILGRGARSVTRH